MISMICISNWQELRNIVGYLLNKDNIRLYFIMLKSLLHWVLNIYVLFISNDEKVELIYLMDV